MNASFFVRNRNAASNKLDNGLLVVTAYNRQQYSNDAAHEFLQESNFWWLCGIEEAGWKLVIDGTRGRSVLVSPVRSETARIFDGGLSKHEALKISGVDDVIDLDEFEPYLRELTRKHTVVHTIYDQASYDFDSNTGQKNLYMTLDRVFSSVVVCNDVLHKVRAIKQPEEIAAIKKAIRLTGQSFEAVKRALPTITYEYEVEALFTYEFRKKNANHAYSPIIAAGRNACTLHYGANKDKIASSQLVLIDVGARVDGYCADISRTYAKSKPNKRQDEVHSAVEAAHYDIIRLLEPNMSVQEYLHDVDVRMKQVIKDLGLLKNSSSNDSYRRYFPHAISHGLGIDVHDSLGSPKYFEENMVLTVEPGIYIPEEAIGVRIEDDVLITKTGNQNLSKSISTAL